MAPPGPSWGRKWAARVCGQCGEAYFDEATTWHIEEIAARASGSGVQVAVQDDGAA